jgi:outer membrane immunogenic protein
MRKFVIAALLAGGLATPAFAQPVGPVAGSGLRVEGIVGYDRNRVEGDSANGVVYGAGVGYDFAAGGAVIGIEGEISDSTSDQCVSGVNRAGDTLCGQFGRDLYVGGRVGGRIGPNSLVYAKAGYTNQRIALDYQDGLPGTTGDFTIGSNLDGLRVGAGVELGIGPNSYVKSEYRYSNYEQGFDRHQVVAGFGFRF